MIVFVETNFILEIALAQEEQEACRSLLNRAATRTITLALPAFCVGETYELWVRRTRTRRDLHRQLTTELSQLSRSEHYRDVGLEAREIARILAHSIDDEKRRLDTALQEICDIANILPIDGPTIRAAIVFQHQLGLSPQDATVLASVEQGLSMSPAEDLKVFATRNAKDFASPDVEALLGQHTCRLITSFQGVLGFIDHGLRLT